MKLIILLIMLLVFCVRLVRLILLSSLFLVSYFGLYDSKWSYAIVFSRGSHKSLTNVLTFVKLINVYSLYDTTLHN